MRHLENDGPSRIAAVATVLIADPFVERTATLAKRLWEFGYDVERCTTLGDAKSMCLDTRPDFVLSKLRLRSGEFDLIAVGRALISDPDRPVKIRDGRWSELQPFYKEELQRLA